MGRKKRKAKPVVEKFSTVQGSAWLRAADVPYTAEQGVSFFVDDERSGIVSREFLDKLLYGVQPSANRAPLMGDGKPLVRAPRAADVARENKELMRELHAAKCYRIHAIDSMMGRHEEGYLRGYIPRDDPGMEELEQRKGLEIFHYLSNRNSLGIFNPDIAAHPAQEDEDRFCVVCLERERTHATIPCGHKHYCETCVAKLVECATCRKTITFNIRIFD
jgi:hypothetical protein